MEKDKNQTITDGLYVLQGSLNRIANALEEVLCLVKEDQAKTAKRMREYDNEDAMLDDLSKPWKETK